MTVFTASELILDLNALLRNWQKLASCGPSSDCAAVVKADAYGIGIEYAVPKLSSGGCQSFFAALPSEAMRVRAVAPKADVYLLCGLIEGMSQELVDNRIRPCLNSIAEVEEWASFCKSAGPQPAAVQFDTGMNRAGIEMDEARALAERTDLLSRFTPTLVMSHFACADEPDHALNRVQEGNFAEIRSLFPGVPASMSNSAATLTRPQSHFDLLRPGVALYGGASVNRMPNAMEPVATATTRILQVRQVRAGDTIGYGASETAARDLKVAVLTSGYADGYHRRAGSSDEGKGAFVAIDGHRAPLIGRVSMDLLTVDVTDIPAALVRRGTMVELFGPTIPIDEVAGYAQTIGYELLTRLGSRYQRRYIGL